MLTTSVVLVIAKFLKNEIRDLVGTSGIETSVEANMASIQRNGQMMETHHREVMSGIGQNRGEIENNGESLNRIEENLRNITQAQEVILDRLAGEPQLPE